AVRYVYNHGAGKDRKRYEDQREAKAQRFRDKYGSGGIGIEGEPQGNVQPYFVGVFDTVAALGSRTASITAALGFLLLAGVAIYAWLAWPWWLGALVTLPPVAGLIWVTRVWFGQFKYFFDDPLRRLRIWNPIDWVAALKN